MTANHRGRRSAYCAFILLAASISSAAAQLVKIATVHFAPVQGDVAANRKSLVDLTQAAAQAGAKLIVHTEMATSGYSYFSRAQIASVAETVPGPSTMALGAIAKQYGVYVVFGLPEYDARTNLYYNSAVMLGPDGAVAGTYRKRSNLLESSYNAEVTAPLPVFDTPYGRVAIVICADMFYPQFPRLAALANAKILLAPSNVGVDVDFLKVRAFENDLAIVVANRFGTGSKGDKPVAFSQETFTIPSPFPYNFNDGTRSVIMSNRGQVLCEASGQQVKICYGDLSVPARRTFPAVRRPSLYSLIGQDTLQPYTFSQLGLPKPAVFAAAAVRPAVSRGDPWRAALDAASKALAAARDGGLTLRLVVYPANYLPDLEPVGLAKLQDFSTRENVDLLLHFGTVVPPLSLLVVPGGVTYRYYRTHRGRDEHIPDAKLSNDFQVVDRDYARLALIQDIDMLAPETAVVMAKLGVDVVAVNADAALGGVLSALWKDRTADYLHLVVANKQGPQGIYLGGYRATPSFREGPDLVIMQMSTADVRSKQEPRFLDFLPLLEPCGHDNC